MHKYSTFVLLQLTFVEGFVVYQSNSTSLCEPLSKLCTEDRTENSIIPFYRKKKERETLKGKYVQKDLPVISDLVMDPGWNPGLQHKVLSLCLGKGGGREHVLFLPQIIMSVT